MYETTSVRHHVRRKPKGGYTSVVKHNRSYQAGKIDKGTTVYKPMHKHGDENGYQGWSNHATWAVKLHWDNNEGDYKYFTEQAEEFEKSGRPSYEFADFLKENYEEMFENVVSGERSTDEAKNMVRDVGNGHDVDWNEIAESYYDEVRA